MNGFTRPGKGKNNTKADAAEDVVLLQKVAEEDRDAFSTLYMKYQPRLVSYCARLLNDDVAQAADIVDEAMFDVWRSAKRFEGKSKPSTWIYSITRNKLISWLRKTSESTLDDDSVIQALVDPSNSMEYELELDDMKQQLTRLMDQLTNEHREVLRLTYFEDKSVKEVAALLDISENTVKTRMFYARKRLAHMLEKAGIVGLNL